MFCHYRTKRRMLRFRNLKRDALASLKLSQMFDLIRYPYLLSTVFGLEGKWKHSSFSGNWSIKKKWEIKTNIYIFTSGYHEEMNLSGWQVSQIVSFFFDIVILWYILFFLFSLIMKPLYISWLSFVKIQLTAERTINL